LMAQCESIVSGILDLNLENLDSLRSEGRESFLELIDSIPVPH
jgi:hypothetical protein